VVVVVVGAEVGDGGGRVGAGGMRGLAEGGPLGRVAWGGLLMCLGIGGL
jgi:hypothetical protein